MWNLLRRIEHKTKRWKFSCALYFSSQQTRVSFKCHRWLYLQINTSMKNAEQNFTITAASYAQWKTFDCLEILIANKYLLLNDVSWVRRMLFNHICMKQLKFNRSAPALSVPCFSTGNRTSHQKHFEFVQHAAYCSFYSLQAKAWRRASHVSRHKYAALLMFTRPSICVCFKKPFNDLPCTFEPITSLYCCTCFFLNYLELWNACNWEGVWKRSKHLEQTLRRVIFYQ